MRWLDVIQEGQSEDVFVHLKYDTNSIRIMLNSFKENYDSLITELWIYRSKIDYNIPVNKNYVKALKNDLDNFQTNIQEVLKDSIDYTGTNLELLNLFKTLKLYFTKIQHIRTQNQL